MKRYLLGLYEKSMPGELALSDKLREAGRAGYDYMELSLDESDEKLARLDWTGGEVAAVRAAQAQTSIPIKSICLSAHRRYPLGHPDREVRARSLEIMEQAIRLADRLGVRLIQIAGYDVYYERSTQETREFFADGLRRSVEAAAREGVTLAFETMETEFLNTVAKAMHWVRACDSPFLQVYPDVGNITNACLEAGQSPDADLRTGKGHIAALHLKETRPGVFREVPYGQGQVDFGRMVRAAWDLGVRMYVGEFWHCGERDWRGILQGNNRFLREVVDRVARQDRARD